MCKHKTLSRVVGQIVYYQLNIFIAVQIYICDLEFKVPEFLPTE